MRPEHLGVPDIGAAPHAHIVRLGAAAALTAISGAAANVISG